MRRSSDRRSSGRRDYSAANGSLANGSSQTGRGPPRSPSLASLVLESDELVYITRMKDILEAFPNKGPPAEPTQLTRHVFIGNQRNADDLGLLRRLGITHVVNCCANRRLTLHMNPYPRITGIFNYIAFAAEDNSEYNILQHLPDAMDQLDHCKRQGGRALVHCNLGINRSGAICASYIMLDEKMTLLNVCELLKKKRSVVLGNKGFRRQLVKFARGHNLLEREVESRQSYLARSGSVTTLPEYSEYSVDIARGEAGIRPIMRVNSTPDDIPHRRDDMRSRAYSSSAGHGQFQRTQYRPFHSGSHMSSLPPLDEIRSAPTTPTRFHPSYCTLPRGNTATLRPSSSSSGLSSKRATSSSHYDQDYFMDAIPEDHLNKHFRTPREADIAPPGEYLPPGELSSRSNGSSSSNKSSSKYNIFSKFTKSKSKSENKLLDSQQKLLERLNDGSDGEWVISSTRPLRIYKRSATDSVLYQKPQHQYKRADTVATTDLSTGMSRMRMREDVEVGEPLSQKHRSSSRTSLVSLGSGFFNKLKSRSRQSLQNF